MRDDGGGGVSKIFHNSVTSFMDDPLTFPLHVCRLLKNERRRPLYELRSHRTGKQSFEIYLTSISIQTKRWLLLLTIIMRKKRIVVFFFIWWILFTICVFCICSLLKIWRNSNSSKWTSVRLRVDQVATSAKNKKIK